STRIVPVFVGSSTTPSNDTSFMDSVPASMSDGVALTSGCPGSTGRARAGTEHGVGDVVALGGADGGGGPAGGAGPPGVGLGDGLSAGAGSTAGALGLPPKRRRRPSKIPPMMPPPPPPPPPESGVALADGVAGAGGAGGGCAGGAGGGCAGGAAGGRAGLPGAACTAAGGHGSANATPGRWTTSSADAASVA